MFASMFFSGLQNLQYFEAAHGGDTRPGMGWDAATGGVSATAQGAAAAAASWFVPPPSSVPPWGLPGGRLPSGGHPGGSGDQGSGGGGGGGAGLPTAVAAAAGGGSPSGMAPVPVLLDCPRQKLRVMPYGHAAESSRRELLYASNIEVGGAGASVSDPATLSPARLSSAAEEASARRGYRMKADFGVGDCCYVDGSAALAAAGRPPSSGVVTALPAELEARDQVR